MKNVFHFYTQTSIPKEYCKCAFLCIWKPLCIYTSVQYYYYFGLFILASAQCTFSSVVYVLKRKGFGMAAETASACTLLGRRVLWVEILHFCS